MAETNPNGANQYQLDPRQKMCWEFYANPTSETFNNGLKSAIKAGYSESHAATITTESWLQEKVRRMNMLGKAEKVLDEMLEMPTEVVKWEKTHYENGEAQYEDVVKTDPGLVKVKQDTAKFVASTVGKEFYSNRSEITGKDGQPIMILPSELIQKHEVPPETSGDSER